MAVDMAHRGSEPSAAPRHVAIIMDGNGRWAQAKRRPRTAGHRRGADAVRGCGARMRCAGGIWSLADGVCNYSQRGVEIRSHTALKKFT